MKSNWFLRAMMLIIILIFASCASDDAPDPSEVDNRVLLVHVNYTDAQFLGAYEYSFNRDFNTFHTSQYFTEPAGTNHGRLAVYYDEVQSLIFEGEIRFLEEGGHIVQPQPWLGEQQWQFVTTADVVTPAEGFEEIWNIMNVDIDFAGKWNTVQRMQLVREYLQSNPGQKVKALLWTPQIGVGHEADWSIIYMLKN
ncbi:MAG: hypothetical protein Q4F57_07065 [Weeksellaceae bacterium]|nr:hypothetical protein [Weeksellaceae bacterium]